MSELLSIIERHGRQQGVDTALLGQKGEAIAAEYLVNKGYRIIVSNFKVPVGRNGKGVQVTGEIDIIALDGEKLVFVEVKTRRSDEFVALSAAVDLRKQRQITRTARVYRRVFGISGIQYRFDVVTVLMANHSAPVVQHLEHFWTEASFRKRAWLDENWYN